MDKKAIPTTMYKYFSCVEHANNFMYGNLYFTSLSNFILTEDETRKDISEGFINLDFSKPGVDVQSFLCIVPKSSNGERDYTNAKILNDPTKFYIHSFSENNNNYEYFKTRVAVKIDNFGEFVSMCRKEISELFSCDCLQFDKVYYYKDSNELKSLGVCNWANPIYKNKKYTSEEEYRLYFYTPIPTIHENDIKNSDSKLDVLIYRYKIKFKFDMSKFCTLIEK